MRRILIIIVILLLVGTGVWLYVRSQEQKGMPVPNVLKAFFPTSTTNNSGSFGQLKSVPNPSSLTSSQTAPVFKEISASPVAGYTIFSQSVSTPAPAATAASTTPVKTSSTKSPASKTLIPTVTSIDQVVRYVSRTNGYVYEIRNGAIPLQITNIFIPNIYTADFADNNNTAILRFLEPDNRTISTYSVPIPPLNTDGTRTQKAGTYLPTNISELAVSPDQTEVARIISGNGGANITTSNSIGTDIKTVAINPFQEWIPLWANKTLYIQTKAASIANGFLYSINQTTAQLTRVVGDMPGLTTSISPSGTYVLYSESTPTGFVTKIFNTKTDATNDISLAILPEKCAWLQNEDLICAGNDSVPSATYPDDWYAGIMHFSDQLYRIDTSSNTYTVLYNGEGQSFDMTNLQVDEDNQLVYFIDKNTGLLWKFSY